MATTNFLRSAFHVFKAILIPYEISICELKFTAIANDKAVSSSEDGSQQEFISEYIRRCKN